MILHYRFLAWLFYELDKEASGKEADQFFYFAYTAHEPYSKVPQLKLSKEDEEWLKAHEPEIKSVSVDGWWAVDEGLEKGEVDEAGNKIKDYSLHELLDGDSRGFMIIDDRGKKGDWEEAQRTKEEIIISEYFVYKKRQTEIGERLGVSKQYVSRVVAKFKRMIQDLIGIVAPESTNPQKKSILNDFFVNVMTQVQVAEKYGVSQPSISKMIARAKAKIVGIISIRLYAPIK